MRPITPLHQAKNMTFNEISDYIQERINELKKENNRNNNLRIDELTSIFDAMYRM